MPRKPTSDGLVRVGPDYFRPCDEPTRDLLLSGLYEAPERFAAKRYIRRDLPVVEFGGSLGVVACAVNRQLKDPKRHVVVEANPEILPILRENRDPNRCEFEIVHGAAGAPGGTVRFYVGRDTLSSSSVAATQKSVEVPVVTLEEILKSHAFERCGLICDIEGAELDLIRNELATLKSQVEIFIVEFHPRISGTEAMEESLRLLKENGFEPLLRHIDYVCVEEHRAEARGIDDGPIFSWIGHRHRRQPGASGRRTGARQARVHRAARRYADGASAVGRTAS
jgi:FkbM family methyltransferase